MYDMRYYIVGIAIICGDAQGETCDALFVVSMHVSCGMCRAMFHVSRAYVSCDVPCAVCAAHTCLMLRAF